MLWIFYTFGLRFLVSFLYLNASCIFPVHVSRFLLPFALVSFTNLSIVYLLLLVLLFPPTFHTLAHILSQLYFYTLDVYILQNRSTFQFVRLSFLSYLHSPQSEVCNYQSMLVHCLFVANYFTIDNLTIFTPPHHHYSPCGCFVLIVCRSSGFHPFSQTRYSRTL